MHAAERHPTAEDIMEYLDGEGLPASRDALASHLAGCGFCQTIATDQRELSRRAEAWTVDAPPDTLQPPRARAFIAWRPTPRLSRFMIGALAPAAVVLLAVIMNVREVAPPPSTSSSYMTLPLGSASVPPASAAEQGQVARNSGRRAEIVEAQPFAAPQAALRVPSVIRTASLRVIVKDFADVRPQVETVITVAAGFADQLTVTGNAGTAHQLHATLRVPENRLAEVLERLRRLGQVVEDTQSSQDVTDQVVDLDARLASARATERRLTDLLQHRTGKLSDVLDVERELARVRLDIERLDAEKANMTRRVQYATVELTISEERKAGLDSGPLPLPTRLRIAALDGVQSALDTVANGALFMLRIGPTLLLWLVAVAIAWRFRRMWPSSASR